MAWPTERLGDVAKLDRAVVQPDQVSRGTRYVGLEHIERGGKMSAARQVSAGELGSAKFAFTDRHVLYGKLRPYLSKIACPSFSGVCSTDIIPVLPGPRIDKHFLMYFLRQPRMVEYASSRVRGANLPRLSPSLLEEFQIPVPSLAEQRRIAEVLQLADALRADRQRVTDLVDELEAAIFLASFARGHHGWPEVQVASVAASVENAIRTGPFGSQLLHSEFIESGIQVLGIDNAVQNRFLWAEPRFISESKYKQLQRYTVRPGDVLITIMGTCGRCAIVPQDIPVAINTKHLCCITLDRTKCLPEFLHSCFLNHPAVLRQLGVRSRGALMPGLNMKIIKELRIPLPPLAIQEEFLRKLRRLDSVGRASMALQTVGDELFGALEHRAFCGDL